MTPNERAALLALVKYVDKRGHSDACKLGRAEDGYRHTCRCGYDAFLDGTCDIRMEDDYDA